MKLESYRLFIETVLRFSYIILVPNFKGLYSVIFQLSSLAINKVNIGKLPIASYTCNFISKVLQEGKHMVAFYSMY